MSQLFEVEITTTLGCPVRCSYCPQDQLLETRGDRKRVLSYEDFVRAVDNIDFKIGLSWTGYSEPCSLTPSGKMLDYAKSKGFYQVISTTLTGKQESIQDAIVFDGWSTFSFHLPDSHGLMTGLKVTSEYAELLDYAMSYRLEKLQQNEETRIICFGDDFHPLIKPIIYKYGKKGLIQSKYVKLRGKVSSRSGGLNEGNLKEVLRFLPDEEHLSSISSVESTPFYCNKAKLNQPCLLPDGSLNICSFDYGFRRVYGDLFKDKLSNIYQSWLNEISDEYLSGKLSPCTECEHYVPLRSDT